MVYLTLDSSYGRMGWETNKMINVQISFTMEIPPLFEYYLEQIEIDKSLMNGFAYSAGIGFRNHLTTHCSIPETIVHIHPVSVHFEIEKQ